MKIQQPASVSRRSASLKLFAIGLARCRIVLMMGLFPVSGFDVAALSPTPATRGRHPDLLHVVWRSGEGICEPPHANLMHYLFASGRKGVVVFVAAPESLF